MKTKILFLLPNLAGGGAERVVLNLIEYLKFNYQIILVLVENKKDYSYPEGIKIFNLNKKRPVVSLPLLLVKLLLILYKEKPAIVVSVLETSHILMTLSKIFYLRSVKWVINSHGITSQSIIEENYSWIKKNILNIGLRLSNKIIVVSETAKNDLITNLNCPQDKIKVIYNGVDVDKILRLKDEKVNEEWFKKFENIIYVGRFEKEKGIIFLIKAFSKLIKEYDYEFRLILIGKGRLENELKKYCSHLNLENHVIFLPFQSNPWKYISKSKFFVLPSLRESFPLVVLEAMLCRCPIVATDVGGVKEIVEDGLDGLLVPPADDEAIVKAIIKLNNDNYLRVKLVENAYKKALNFDIKKTCQGYRKEIEFLL